MTENTRTNLPGYRNERTTVHSAWCFSSGLSHNEVIFKLFDYNKQYNKPPLMPSEIFHIANHFSKYDKESQTR